jgi:hypothetical protein
MLHKLCFKHHVLNKNKIKKIGLLSYHTTGKMINQRMNKKKFEQVNPLGQFCCLEKPKILLNSACLRKRQKKV